jgi:hypothetical protein
MLNQTIKTLCICAIISFVSCVPLPSFGVDDDRDTPTEPYVPNVTYTNDSYEPNNNSTTATIFSTDSIVKLICIPGEYDYFKVPVDSNTQTVLYFRTVPDSSLSSYGSISLTLYSHSMTSIKTRSVSIASVKADSVVYFSPVKDTIIISVYKMSSYTSETKYALTKKESPVQISDILEPNNSALTASFLTDSLLCGFIATSSDTDCYKIPVVAGTQVVLNMYFDSANTFTIASSCSIKTGSLASTQMPGILPKPSYSYSCYTRSDDTILLKIYNVNSVYSSPYYSKILMPGRYSITVSKTKILNDVFEPNQTPSEAKTIKAGKIDSLYVIGNEYDYYRLTFDSTTYVEALLKKLQPSTASMSFAIERRGSTLLTAPSSTSDSLKLSYIVNAGDTVYLRIYNPASTNATSSLPYLLDIRTTSASQLDSMEPNDTKVTARLLQSSLKSVLLGQNDTDYYKIPIPKSSEMQITVSSDSLTANYCTSNLTVGSANRLNESTSSYTKLYNYYAITNDTAVLKVYRPSGSSSTVLFTNYSITLTPTKVRDDRFELNDTARGGTKLSAGVYDSLILVAADTDSYFFTSDTAVFVGAILTSGFTVSSESYLSFTAQSALDNSATQSQSQFSTLSLRSFVAAGDTIFYKVTGYNKLATRSTALGYSLSIRLVPVSAIDTLEPNNTLTKAISLKNLTTLSSQLYCSSDTDYYSLPLYHEYFYRVLATGDAAKSIPVTFVVSDYQNKSRSTGTSSTTQLGFDLRTNSTDSVYIKVYRQSTKQINTGCTYTLSVQTVKVDDDTFETNDTKTTAYTITPKKYDSLTAFLGNPDFFKIDIDSGSTLIVTTNFTSSIPQYGLFLLNFESADSIITSTSIATGTSLVQSHTFNKKETVYLKTIYTNSSQTNTYFVKYGMDVRVIMPGK